MWTTTTTLYTNTFIKIWNWLDAIPPHVIFYLNRYRFAMQTVLCWCVYRMRCDDESLRSFLERILYILFSLYRIFVRVIEVNASNYCLLLMSACIFCPFWILFIENREKKREYFNENKFVVFSFISGAKNTVASNQSIVSCVKIKIKLWIFISNMNINWSELKNVECFHVEMFQFIEISLWFRHYWFEWSIFFFNFFFLWSSK